MDRSSTIRILVVLSLLAALQWVVNGEVATAQLPFKRSRSQATNNRDLTIKNGPWLIMCASFSGESAEESALQLVNKLKSHRLSAFLYRHSFDYSGNVQGLGWQEPDSQGNFSRRPKVMKSANLDVVREVAVLVGDFPSPDDGRAESVLQKIKSLRITSVPELTANNGTPTTPLKTAFMMPNPMLPEDYFRQPKVDKFIANLNKKFEHSLLKCPGLYSVRVASFRGEAIIDQERINNGSFLQSLKKDGAQSRLVVAAEKAHNLTRLLRSKGIEAYEFHDRTESYVCIGSFDWVTRETNDRVMNNPEIVKIVDICKPEIRNLPGAPNSILPKSLRGIPFDPEPTPILVPKHERSTRSANRLGFLKR